MLGFGDCGAGMTNGSAFRVTQIKLTASCLQGSRSTIELCLDPLGLLVRLSVLQKARAHPFKCPAECVYTVLYNTASC